MLLADLGARVVKIESLDGDQVRVMLPFPEAGGVRVTQGKESICVDVQTDEGKAIVVELASKVDVVLQGFRAGVVERLGLDDASIRRVNPDVIYVNANGYGVDGPYGRKPAYAPSIAAAIGVSYTNLGSAAPTGEDSSLAEIRNGARRLYGAGALANAQPDGLAALGVASAIMFGIVARDRGHGGQELFTSMLSTGAHVMSAQTVDWPGSVAEASVDADLRGFQALYRVYDAATGFVFLAAPTQHEWERLVATPAFAGLGHRCAIRRCSGTGGTRPRADRGARLGVRHRTSRSMGARPARCGRRLCRRQHRRDRSDPAGHSARSRQRLHRRCRPPHLRRDPAARAADPFLALGNSGQTRDHGRSTHGRSPDRTGTRRSHDRGSSRAGHRRLTSRTRPGP